jgi:hypothetical protein
MFVLTINHILPLRSFIVYTYIIKIKFCHQISNVRLSVSDGFINITVNEAQGSSKSRYNSCNGITQEFKTQSTDITKFKRFKCGRRNSLRLRNNTFVQSRYYVLVTNHGTHKYDIYLGLGINHKIC